MDNLPYSSGAPPRGSDKVWTLLCHLSLFIGLPFLLPLIVYLAMKNDSEYVAANAREALNFHISILIYMICCLPFVLILIGFPMIWLIGLCAAIFAVIAAVKSAEGGCYRYPLTLRLI